MAIEQQLNGDNFMMNSAIKWLRAVLFTGLAFMLILQLAACEGDTKKTVIVSGPADNRADQFVAGLKADGHVVQEGSMPLSDIAYYTNYNVTDSAAGFNYGVPYKRLQIPSPETEDEPVKSSGIFRLQPYEAIVYVGLTPPSGDYFSFTAFLWSRFAGKISKKGDWIFAALGDPLNNTQIKVEGGGNTFQKNTIIIFTADQAVNDRIVAQAKAAGYPESMINTYVIPSKLLHMGVNALDATNQDDSFLILVRAANVYNAKSLSDYNSNDNYARVFRVTPTTNNMPNPLKPYDTPPMAIRTAKAEQDLVATQKSLTDSLKDLKEAIIAKTPHLQYKDYSSTRWFAESRDILLETDRNSSNYHKFVAGEASDTPYLRSSSGDVAANFTLGEDDMVIVYGINHAATGLSTYSNFAVYGEKILCPCPDDPILPSIPPKYTFGCGDPIWGGVVGMGNRDSKDPLYGKNHFTDSANYYIPNDPNKKYLYAVRVLRQAPSDPERKPWIVVPEPTAEGGPASGISLTDPMFIGYRAYVSPITGHGPDYDDIIPDQAIWFKTK
ncbi:MAG TPA: hypothetical protein PLL36_11050 [Candidatus Hydrogenedentes bacterium]|nr:hypothetical protein [Candidatus Hydrogenedentota bacterium]